MKDNEKQKPKWLETLIEDVREASKAFCYDKWPDAWLYIGEGEEEDWYDWDAPLFGLPVYHSPAYLHHSGYNGEQQRIIPIWIGDVSGKKAIQHEFECRLAKSGDY